MLLRGEGHRRLLGTCTYFSVFSGAGRPFRRAPALLDHLLHLHPAISHTGRFAQYQWMGSKPPPRKRNWAGEFEYSVTGSSQDLDTGNLSNRSKDRAGDFGPALKIRFSGPTWTGLVARFPIWSIARTHLSCYSHFSRSTSKWVNNKEVKHHEGKGMGTGSVAAGVSVVSVCSICPAPHQCAVGFCRKHETQKAFNHIQSWFCFPGKLHFLPASG